MPKFIVKYGVTLVMETDTAEKAAEVARHIFTELSDPIEEVLDEVDECKEWDDYFLSAEKKDDEL